MLHIIHILSRLYIERERETDRQTDRQRQRQTEIETQKDTERERLCAPVNYVSKWAFECANV